MIKVLSVFGTRPEAIKMAPVVNALAERPDTIDSYVCSTGQHREMLAQVLNLFEITPDFNLNVMQPNQTLTSLTANLLTAFDEVIQTLQPDWVLAQGDTTTVMVAALLAHYHRIKFGHVEAGLRTGDKFRPFPEEANRRLADALADAYFAPTQHSRAALLDEGIDDDLIFVTGNTVVDALLDIAQKPYDWENSPLHCIPTDKRLVLITAHRRESFGDTFRQLCTAIQVLAGRFEDDVHFVYPVHLNPNVQKPVYEMLIGFPNISLIEPLDYLSLIQLMRRSTLVLTDSGGIQEEAPTFEVPVLIMRDTTERPEGVAAGVARLVGTGCEQIVETASQLLSDPRAHALMTALGNPYGDGHAAERIADIVGQYA